MFKRVSAIFSRLDEDGGGEIDRDEWVHGLANYDDVYEQIQALIPYKRFFKEWAEGDTTLTPILSALSAADPEDNFTIIRREKTTMLAQEAKRLVEDKLEP